MTELFESTMDNVRELEVRGYSDPVNMERTMEILAKRGDEEYVYKFTGPGIEKFEAAADGRCWKENKKLKEAYEKLCEEKQQLKKENEELWSRIRQLEEMIKKLECDNTLNKETADTWSKEYYNLSKKFDKLQEDYRLLEDRGCNANIHGKDYTLDQLVDRILELEEENERIKENIKSQHKLTIGLDQKNHELQEELDERTVNAVAAKEKSKLLEIENEKLKKELHSLKQEKSKIPMVDDCLKLSKEIEKLTFEKEMMKKGNEKFKKVNERLRNENQKLKKDLQELKVAFPMTVNKILCGEGELKVEKEDTDRVDKASTRADILEQAKECVCGHREQDYGTPESNFQLIADLWNGYLGFLDHPQDQIRATDVAMLMALMKIARIRNGGGSGDSFVDLAGYAACGGEIWDGERHKDK